MLATVLRGRSRVSAGFRKIPAKRGPRMAKTPAALRVGVVGAGPWAEMVHAPMLQRSTEVDFVGVWGRRIEASQGIAAQFGTRAFSDLDALIAECDALTFCLPPDVQNQLAQKAALAGKALLLEKPVALSLASAEELARVVDEARVPTQLFLTWRYAASARGFLQRLTGITPTGGRGIFVNGLQFGGAFATPWRLAEGPLFDLGPHVIDFLEAAMGPVVEIRASGDLLGWVALTLIHENAAVSQASLSFGSVLDRDVATIEIFTPQGHFPFDCEATYSEHTIDTVLREFVRCVREDRAHELDLHHGLHLQRLLEEAAGQLRRS